MSGLAKPDILKVVWNWITFSYVYSSRILRLICIPILILKFLDNGRLLYITIQNTRPCIIKLFSFFGLMNAAAKFG